MALNTDLEKFTQGLSIMDHVMANQSYVGAALMNGMSINHGFTPRLSYNCSNVTTAQLAEFVATLAANLHKLNLRLKDT